MNNTAPTVTALITARALVASHEAAARLNPLSRSASYAVSAARSAVTKRAVEAVAAGEAVAVFDLMDSLEDRALRRALNKAGLHEAYCAACNAALKARAAARRAL
jgi:hypothetical protein